MTYESCPTEIVDAPIAIVWSLLTQPADWGSFFDLKIQTVNPAGAAVVGQTIRAKSGPMFLRFNLSFECTEVDATAHRLKMNVHLPFGIDVFEDLDCIAIGRDRCRVNYHCNFNFPRGWRGAIQRYIMRRELDAGPVDSLSRLKRAAEVKFAALQSKGKPSHL